MSFKQTILPLPFPSSTLLSVLSPPYLSLLPSPPLLVLMVLLYTYSFWSFSYILLRLLPLFLSFLSLSFSFLICPLSSSGSFVFLSLFSSRPIFPLLFLLHLVPIYIPPPISSSTFFFLHLLVLLSPHRNLVQQTRPVATTAIILEISQNRCGAAAAVAVAFGSW